MFLIEFYPFVMQCNLLPAYINGVLDINNVSDINCSNFDYWRQLKFVYVYVYICVCVR